MKTSVVHARIEPQTKSNAEEILHKLGLTPTEAIRIFYRQINLRGGLPFNIALPNELTERALAKSRKGKEVHGLDSLDDMFEAWDKCSKSLRQHSSQGMSKKDENARQRPRQTQNRPPSFWMLKTECSTLFSLSSSPD